MSPRPKAVEVLYEGGLDAREHAIADARRWQLEVARENAPAPSVPYLVVVGLLMTFPAEELLRVYRKAGIA